MRPFFLAWLTLALLLLVLGSFTAADDGLPIAGFPNTSGQQASDSHFQVGDDAAVVVKQERGLQRRLKTHAE